MEGSVESQTVVSQPKELIPEPEPVQQNGAVEDVVSTNGASEEKVEAIEEDPVSAIKRKSVDADGDQEVECKKLKTSHPEGEEVTNDDEEKSEEKVDEEKAAEVEAVKPESEVEKPEEQQAQDPEVEKTSEVEQEKEAESA